MNLDTLPIDWLAVQITYLPFSDVLFLCQTNRRINDFCLNSDNKYDITWKNIITNTFGSVNDYHDKLRKISYQYCTFDDLSQTTRVKQDKGICYNYKVYTNLVKELDSVTQAMIYYRQNDTKSLAKIDPIAKLFAAFLLQDLNILIKIVKSTPTEQVVYNRLRSLMRGERSKDIVRTLLHQAVQLGNQRMVKYLISNVGNHVYGPESSGEYATIITRSLGLKFIPTDIKVYLKQNIPKLYY